jgi:peptide/nickel transport system substrate-binding protein
VEFHDGTKMTAKDVAYSIQTQVAPNGPSPNSATAGVFLSPSGVTVLDPYTVRLTLNKPNSFFYVYLQNRFMRVIKNGAPAVTTNHIGTGPFVFKSFVPGQSFVATRNPNYWQEGKPYLDSLQLLQIPEPSAQYQALEAGQVDMMEELTPALAKTLSASASNTVLALPNDEWYFMIMDPRKNPVFRNTKLIQAVKASVNRQQIINDVFSGYAQLGYDEPIASADAFFDSQLKLPEQDLTEARALLREAGYPNGVNIGQLNTAAITGAAIDFAVAIQQQLAAVNIHCTIKETPAATYYDNIWLKEPLYVSYNLSLNPPADFRQRLDGSACRWSDLGSEFGRGFPAAHRLCGLSGNSGSGSGPGWPSGAVEGCCGRVWAGQAAAAGGPQAASNKAIHCCSRCQLAGRCSVMWPRPCRAVRAATSIRSRRSVAPRALP